MDHSSPADGQSGGDKLIKEEEPDEDYICTTTICGNSLTVALSLLKPREKRDEYIKHYLEWMKMQLHLCFVFVFCSRNDRASGTSPLLLVVFTLLHLADVPPGTHQTVAWG